MPSSKPRIPKYRHYRPKNLGVVRLDGKDHYLGRYDSPESWEKYHALIADWLAGRSSNAASNGAATKSPVRDVTVNQILLAYMKYARTYYVRDGEPTREVDGIRDSLRPVRTLFGSTPAAEFGPLRLKTVRQQWRPNQ